jgi:WD40 repeat protein
MTSDACTILKEGHYRGVNCVVFSPDGNLIASASKDCTIQLWSTDTNTPVHSLTGHCDEVTSIVFTNDRKWLVSGSIDGTVRLWSLTSLGWSRILREEVKSKISCVAFSPGEKYIVYVMDGTIVLSGKDGYIVRTLIGHDEVNSLAFTPDGKFLISGSDGFNLTQWSIETGEYSYFNSSSYKPNWIKCAAFTPDGKFLVSGSNDTALRVWSHEGDVVKTLTGHEGYVRCIAFSPDGKFLASGSHRTIIIRSTETWEVLNILKDVGVVTSVAFSPNGQFLVSGFEGSSCLDDTIKIWTIPISVNE